MEVLFVVASMSLAATTSLLIMAIVFDEPLKASAMWFGLSLLGFCCFFPQHNYDNTQDRLTTTGSETLFPDTVERQQQNADLGTPQKRLHFVGHWIRIAERDYDNGNFAAAKAATDVVEPYVTNTIFERRYFETRMLASSHLAESGENASDPDNIVGKKQL